MILDFQNIKNNSSLLSSCGGKGSNLFFLKEAGLNVPEFLIIPSDTFYKEFSEQQNAINAIIANINKADDVSITEASKKIQQIIESCTFTDKFLQTLKQKAIEVFGGDYLVSVRSSAISEDGAKDSFAGMLTSFLYVGPDEIIIKIKSVYSSVYGERVLKYKILKGIDLSNSSMAVVIQKMINSEKAGVVFSRNATGNLNEILIVAGYGQGEGIVSDRTEADCYYIDRQNKNIRQSIKEKHIFLGIDEITMSGLKEFKVETNKSKISVLNNIEIEKLSELALKIEEYKGFPQDIEFAIDPQKEIFLLQTRNITTINPSEIKILDNSNIVESYPGITLPLSFTFARIAYKNVFTGTMRLFKISEKESTGLDSVLSNLITHFNGRVYYNLHHWYKIVSLVIASEESLKAWENLIGIRNNEKKSIKISKYKKLRSAFVLISLILKYKKLTNGFFFFFNKEYSELRNFVNRTKTEAIPVKEIFQFYDRKSTLLFEGWAPTIVNDFFTFKTYDVLKKMVLLYGFKEEENVTNDLLCGIEGVESEMPVITLLTLKESIENNKELIDIFKNQPAEILKLISNSKHSRFKEKFDEYIDKYGDRTLEELKLETQNIRMNAEQLVSMIQNQLSTDNSVKKFRDKQESIRKEAEEKIKLKQPAFSCNKIVFNILLQRTRLSVKNRENMRFARTRAYGIVKELFLAIADQMVNEKIILQKTDIFYLTTDEVKSFCIDSNKAALTDKIAERKIEFEKFKLITLPDRIMYQGDHIPEPEITNSSEIQHGNLIRGIGVSKGKVKAKAVVIDKPSLQNKINGEILITTMTDPGWIFLMSQAGGIISEKGSLLSHTAIVGRELGIPTIVGVNNATKIIQTGCIIEMNGDTGEIRLNFE